MTVIIDEPAPTTAPQTKQSATARRWWMKAEPRKAAHSRICRELTDLWLDPPAYCRPGAEPVTDTFHWEVIIDGPPGTPYAGGTFPVDVWYPYDYPFRPPKLTFKTKVYHPNIDEEGQMVVDVLHGYWLAGFTIHRLLLAFVSILYDPLLDYPINEDIAEQYENEYELYKKEAREWTQKYSSTPIVSHWLPKAMRTPPVVPHIPATAKRRRRKVAASKASSSLNQQRRRKKKFVEDESVEENSREDSRVCSGLVS